MSIEVSQETLDRIVLGEQVDARRIGVSFPACLHPQHDAHELVAVGRGGSWAELQCQRSWEVKRARSHRDDPMATLPTETLACRYRTVLFLNRFTGRTPAPMHTVKAPCLGALADADRPLTLAEVVRATGLPASKARNALTRAAAGGWVTATREPAPLSGVQVMYALTERGARFVQAAAEVGLLPAEVVAA